MIETFRSVLFVAANKQKKVIPELAKFFSCWFILAIFTKKSEARFARRPTSCSLRTFQYNFYDHSQYEKEKVRRNYTRSTTIRDGQSKRSKEMNELR